MPILRASLNLPGITITLGPTDHLVIEDVRILRATLVAGEGKWEYFGDIRPFQLRGPIEWTAPGWWQRIPEDLRSPEDFESVSRRWRSVGKDRASDSVAAWS